MKKRKNQPLPEEAIRNPVAKFAHQFNKAQVFEDKRQYRRNNKHRKQEAPLITFIQKVISETSCGFMSFDVCNV